MLFKSTINKSKIFIRGKTNLIADKNIRLLNLHINNSAIRIVSIDRKVDLNILLPIPKPLDKIVDHSLYYNIEPFPYLKRDIIFENIDLTDNHISVDNVRYICHAAVLDILEYSGDQAYINLIVSLLSGTADEFESRMFLHVKIEENLEERFLNSFHIRKHRKKSKIVPSTRGEAIPITELSIDKFVANPIWELALEEEALEFQDETWVKPAKTNNFTEELNGSFVLGELMTNDVIKFPIICNIDIRKEEVVISSVILYEEREKQYYALEDKLKPIDFPLYFNISLMINGDNKSLKFIADKVDVYKNEIKTSL
jgi:hypothetical protein